MMTSVDGKILGQTWGENPQVKKLINKYEEAHETFGINAWICGRTTFERDFTKGAAPIFKEGTDVISREDFIGDNEASSFAIAVDGKGKLGWESNNLLSDHVITILTESVSDQYLRHLRSINVSYIFAGKSEIDLKKAMIQLRSLFGIETLLLEGGGRMNGSFIQEKLVNEFHQLLLPIIDGKDKTSTAFEIDNSKVDHATLLSLKAVSRLDDDVVLMKYFVQYN